MNLIFSLFVILLQQLPISINHGVLTIYVFLSSFTYMDLLYRYLIVHFNEKLSNTVQSLQLFRSLHLLSLNDTKMQSSLAQMIIHTLLESSCDLHTLEISEINIAGWLSKLNKSSTNSLALRSDIFMNSLSILNLRYYFVPTII